MLSRLARGLVNSVLLVLAAWAMPALADTEFIVNGGFEVPTVSNASAQMDTWRPANNAALAAAGFGWTVGGDSVDVVGRFWAPASGAQSLDLTGTAPGSISQTFDTTPSATYILRFRYSSFRDTGNRPPTMTVRWAPAAAPGSADASTYTFTGSSTKQDMAWASIELELKATSTRTTLSFTGNPVKGGNPFGVALDDVSVQLKALPPPTIATPVLLRAVAQAGSTAYVVGRIDGGAGQALTLQPSLGSSCVGGVLVGGSVLPAVQVTPDAGGYFAVTVAGVQSGRWLAAQVTAPQVSGISACVVSSGDNDFWPKALDLSSTSSTVQIGDYVDIAGKSRWYKLAVQPGQSLGVRLSGLPADYDLAVFKDIGQAYLGLLQSFTTADVTRLSAEYAPSMFSPSMFSPSMFSPSMFSPEEVIQAFSSAQTRSLVAYSATFGTADELSVVNTWNDTGYFYVRVSGKSGAFSTTGQFQLAVTESASTCTAVTDRTISTRAAEPAANVGSVILVDGSKLDLAATVPGGGTLGARLDALAARVGGVVRDIGTDARVVALRAQAEANPKCPFAKNLLAREIKGIVDGYRPSNPLKYVVLVGNDGAIPFFRYPDQSLLGQESGYVPPVQSNSASDASLRRDYVLNQDAYGSKTAISLRVSEFPVPDLAVGRLVESPADIAGVIDAFLGLQGPIVPSSALVTGYDFLADAATAVKAELDAGLGLAQPTTQATAVSTELIAPNGVSPQSPQAWSADALEQALLGTRHDLVFLAGHFSANTALAADFRTGMVTWDLAASNVNLANSIVFSAGCHAGYNIVDSDAIEGVTWPLDWAQAFAGKKATLIAGTGYQYGDTDLLEYSERLYRNFARQLHAGVGPVAVGDALVKAKLDYLKTTPDLRGLHEKALLEATLFGLPMLAVDMPAGRGTVTDDPALTTTPVDTLPGSALGLQTFEQAFTFASTEGSVQSRNAVDGTTVTSSYLAGNAGVASNPAEPVLPLFSFNATPASTSTANDSGIVLRGIGFRGGSYTEQNVVPLTGAPSTELRGVHGPFTSPVFFPMRLATANYFDSLSGAGRGVTRLLITPAQHKVADPANFTATRRQYSDMTLKLYYSGVPTGAFAKAALSDAPAIVSVDATAASAPPLFTAQVIGDPAAGIQDVWVTWTSGNGTWQSLDLVQCTFAPPATLPAVCGTTSDSRIWKGQLPADPGAIHFIVQAASGTGLVTLDDNFGEYYVVNAAARTATALAFVAPPASVNFGSAPQIKARLTAGSAGIAGKLVAVGVGPNAQVALTDATGNVSITLPTAAAPGSYVLTGSFGGDTTFKPATATTPLTIQKAPTSLAALGSLGARLTGTLGTKTQSMAHETVAFTVSGTRYSGPVYAITDYEGNATLPPPGLPAGSYSVSAATYAGNATYALSTIALAQAFNVAQRPQGITFDMPLPDLPAGSADFTAYASASSQLPVTFAVTVGSTCTVTNGPAPGTATVHLTGPGTCGLRASQAGNADWVAAADVVRSFAITGAVAGSFAPTAGAMNVARWGHTATLLNDGRVLIVGGYDTAGNRLDSYELFNPGTGLFTGPFTLPGGMAVGGHTATLLENVAGDGTSGLVHGGVLIAGGAASGGLNLAWFNPLTDTFTAYSGSTFEFSRTFATATLQADGRVFVAGGSNSGGILTSTAIFDPTRSPLFFEPGFDMERTRELHTATLSADGKSVLLAGGRNASTGPNDTMILYRLGYVNSDPFDQAGIWDFPFANMVTPRYMHQAELLGPDFVLFGGSDTGGAPTSGATSSVECLGDVPAHASTSCFGGLLQGRRMPTATKLTDNSVLVAGGMAGVSTLLGSTERSAPASGPFVAGPSLVTPRWFHRATRLQDGRVLITGGADAAGTALAAAEIFSDPALPGAPPPASPAASMVQISPTRYSPHTGPASLTFDLWASGDRTTGTVTIRENDPVSGPILAGCNAVALVDGNSHGSCTTSALTYGNYNLYLVYAPADPRTASSASRFDLFVADWSYIDLQISAPSPVVGTPVTLQATLTYADANTLNPDGAPITPASITFYDNDVAIPGCQNLAVDGSGLATCTATFGSPGFRYVGAGWSGTSQIRLTMTQIPVTVSP